MEKLQFTTKWIHESDLPPLSLVRHDSYFEHLAGPFFPPDAHDFDGKQRAMVMATESNVNYDQYWKEKYVDKEESNDSFQWDINSPNSDFKAEQIGDALQIRKLYSSTLALKSKPLLGHHQRSPSVTGALKINSKKNLSSPLLMWRLQ